MYEYVGTARTFWVPWLTSERMGDGGMVVWGVGDSGSEGGWRHCGAWSGCGRMLKAVEACSDHIYLYPRTFSTLVVDLHATPDGVMGHGDQ